MADIENIPQGWELRKLGDICEVITGTTPPKSNPANYGNEMPFFKPPHLWDTYVSDTHEKLSSQGIKKARTAPVNTVLVTCIGNLGRTAILKKTAAFNQQINAIIENDNVRGKYIFYQAQSSYFKKQLEKFATGTTVSIVNKSNFEKILVTIPPVKTQQAIVSKIEELFSELDKGIAELKLAQEQLKVYRQSVLKYAFEGKLTNDNVKDGKLPDGWKQIKLNEIVKISTEKHSPDNEEELFYIGLEHIEKNTGKLTNSAGFESIKTLKNKFKKGDILYGKLRPNLNKVFLAQEDGVCSTDILVLKVSEKCEAKYLCNIMLSVGFVNLMSENTSGVNLPRVSSKFILGYEISLPPLTEQYRIIKEIESRLSVADKMEESITESLQKAEALRQSILKKAFSGELVKEVKAIEVPKIKNEYFHQLQLVALVINGFKKVKIDHGEMTLAKNLYLLDSIYKIPTGFKYDRWHLGPYPPTLKKVVNNKEYFKRNELFIEATNDDKLQKYTNLYQDEVNAAISDLSAIFSNYKGAERSHKTELLATVCKVIEDIKSTNLAEVRQSMGEWKIDLKTSTFKNKAEKFNEPETKKCIEFIVERGWDRKLI